MMTRKQIESIRQAIPHANPDELRALLDPWNKGLTTQELQRIQGHAQAGIAIDVEALLAPFNFLIFPITSWDVDTGVIQDFRSRLGMEIRQSGFTCKLDGIMLVVMILESDVPARGNSQSVRKSGGGCKVRRQIDIVEWQAAGVKAKKLLLEHCVSAALASIPDKHLSAPEKEMLKEIVQRALHPRKKRSAPPTSMR